MSSHLASRPGRNAKEWSSLVANRTASSRSCQNVSCAGGSLLEARSSKATPGGWSSSLLVCTSSDLGTGVRHLSVLCPMYLHTRSACVQSEFPDFARLRCAIVCKYQECAGQLGRSAADLLRIQRLPGVTLALPSGHVKQSPKTMQCSCRTVRPQHWPEDQHQPLRSCHARRYLRAKAIHIRCDVDAEPFWQLAGYVRRSSLHNVI